MSYTLDGRGHICAVSDPESPDEHASKRGILNTEFRTVLSSFPLIGGFSSGRLEIETDLGKWGSIAIQHAVTPLLIAAALLPGVNVQASYAALTIRGRWTPSKDHGGPVPYLYARLLLELAFLHESVASSEAVFEELRAALERAHRTIRDGPKPQGSELEELEDRIRGLIQCFDACDLELLSDKDLTVERFLEGDRASAVRRYTPDDLRLLFKHEAGHEFDDVEQMREFAKRVMDIIRPAGLRVSSKSVAAKGGLNVSGKGISYSFRLSSGGTTVQLGAPARVLPAGLTIS